MAKARALTIFCVPSLALFLALLAVRARSFHYADYLSHCSPTATLDFYSECGGLHFERSAGTAGSPSRWMYLRLNVSPHPSQDDGSLAGPFEWRSDSTTGQSRLSVPYWSPMLLAMALPVWWAWQRRSKHPAWARHVVAAAIALWPMELILLHPSPQDTGWGLALVWLVLAVMAVVVLGVLDLVRMWVWGRRDPWPWQWRLRRDQDRARRGLCLRCGYDLRASGEAGGELLARCPECGTPSGPQPLPVVSLSLQPTGGQEGGT